MSTDQNSTRDRDQVRISGGPGAPGESTAVTEPSATSHDTTRDDVAGHEPHAGERHAPTDPGTDGTHTASDTDLTHTPSDTGLTHTASDTDLPHTASDTDRAHTASDTDGTHSTTHSDGAYTASDSDGAHDKSHSAVVTDDAASADGLSGKPTITADPVVSGEPTTDHHADHDTTPDLDAEPHSATVSREPAVPATTATTPQSVDTADKPFFDRDLLDVLETRWKEVQGSFVDNPHDAVTRADLLVAETVEQITTRWSERQQQLQGRWSRGTDGDTEDLRQALREYRDFFQKLLTLGN
ncbi:hypothetical protein [Nocardia asteroides]|uniref:hypothetical protein n=1 Tax=Nocardia asteroides TaxID=1824 RepID=UPI001E4142C3|nr:hypothetical protein [Nocardia asteroides]UGT64269.1 hypothetical protein LTT61_13685 [Nocardia asteroides]